MPGEKTRKAIFAQPDWLRAVPAERRLPAGRILHTGCGTSFHAAQTGGWAEQALELVLRPRQAGVLVALNHEGDTPPTRGAGVPAAHSTEGATPLRVEAAQAFDGPVWLVTAKPDSPLGELAAEVLVATPEVEQSWCHTASYTCAVATLAALGGDDVSAPPAAVEAAWGEREPVTSHDRF